jgi:uncharacterized membrane protein
MFKQQRDASVGKDDVGISANGLKVLFALTDYYNNIYKNVPEYNVNAELATTTLTDQIRRGNSSFIKNFKFVNSKGNVEELNIAGISDIQINNNQKKLLEKAFGRKVDLLKENAAISASAFTSAATDNAKELLMAKINASVELASMHLYMLSLGITPDQVVEFMSSKIGNTIVKRLEKNQFIDSTPNYVNSILSSITAEANEEGSDYTENDKITLNSFKQIYAGAQEFKTLASILKINQKTSANINEVNNFLSKLEKSIYNRENTIFNQSLKSLRYFGEESEKLDSKNRDNKLLDMIFKNNSQLDSVLDRDYVTKILNDAKNIEVNYIDKDGNILKKNVSILGGQFDFRYYIDPKNKEYREITKNYYNLLKDTINIFDVIEKVPHFKAMIDGLILSHNILMNLSKKYNFIFGVLKDIVNDRSNSIVSLNKEDNVNPNINNYMGNPALPIIINDKIISKALLFYDKQLVAK